MTQDTWNARRWGGGMGGIKRARTVLLHGLQELDDHLGGGADQNLALAALLSVRHRLQCIGQNAHAHHLDC